VSKNASIIEYVLMATVWWNVLIYNLTLGLLKITILIFYLRLFPYKQFRQWTWATMVFIFAVVSILLGLAVFQCKPIAHFWNKDIAGKCISYDGVVFSAASLIIFTDILIVCLPIPVIRKLNLTSRRKLGVLLMFALGSLYVLVLYEDPIYAS